MIQPGSNYRRLMQQQRFDVITNPSIVDSSAGHDKSFLLFSASDIDRKQQKNGDNNTIYSGKHGNRNRFR